MWINPNVSFHYILPKLLIQYLGKGNHKIDIPVIIYLFKVNSRNTKLCSFRSKFTITISERHHWRRSGFSIGNFEQSKRIIEHILFLYFFISSIHVCISLLGIIPIGAFSNFNRNFFSGHSSYSCVGGYAQYEVCCINYRGTACCVKILREQNDEYCDRINIVFYWILIWYVLKKFTDFYLRALLIVMQESRFVHLRNFIIEQINYVQRSNVICLET